MNTYPNILLIANLIYVKVEYANSKPKYLSGSISGVLFGNNLYSLEEIKEKHKDENLFKLREINLFTDIHDIYYGITKK